jgi:hypothetical protein
MTPTLTALIANLESAKASAMARHGHYPSVIDETIAFLTLRQGCMCSCCDHGEGSDCGCECHSSGACSSNELERALASQPAEESFDDALRALSLVPTHGRREILRGLADGGKRR